MIRSFICCSQDSRRVFANIWHGWGPFVSGRTLKQLAWAGFDPLVPRLTWRNAIK